MLRALRTLALGAAVLLLVAACQAATGQADGTDAGAATSTTVEEPIVELTGSMSLAPSSGVVGSSFDLSAEGLAADTTYAVEWVTADGAWVLQGDRSEEYHGRVHNEVLIDLGSVTTDGQGSASGTFEVPSGFGFAHDVRLVDADDVIRNKALFDVDMEVRVTPSSGPLGTPITIEVTGMGYRTLENTRTIVYDNVYVGFLSAVTTEGRATAVIPATGNVGPHRIAILRGAYTFPYLNPQQSPRPDILTYDAVFTITDGEPVLPPPVAEQNPGAVMRSDTDASSGTWISTDVLSAPVGTDFTVVGDGFAPNTPVDLRWYRVVGNRVGGQGWDEVDIDLAEVVTDANGALTATATVPRDVGGAHRLSAEVDGEPVADVDMFVTPAIEAISPESGPWGTEIVITISGVGWTETANIYTLTYDNSYVGYACGFNSQGDVEIRLSAVGTPGWHYIDLYPAIYKGKESPGQQNFRIPQLTFADDHPGEDLPAFHLAFYLEED
jgi:hypothetical protein